VILWVATFIQYRLQTYTSCCETRYFVMKYGHVIVRKGKTSTLQVADGSLMFTTCNVFLYAKYINQSAKTNWKRNMALVSFVTIEVAYCRYRWPRGLTRRSRPLSCRDRGFEYRRGHGCLSIVTVMCCQIEISATSCPLVQRSPTDCDASLCVI